jgi:subtilisin family serine protease
MPPEHGAKVDGAAGTVIAVLDCGLDINHPDLAAAVFRNNAEISGHRIDDEGKGLIDDVNGYDFHNNDNNPSDDNGHGTHVSGTIAAVANGTGMQGVAYGARILALKFLGEVCVSPMSGRRQLMLVGMMPVMKPVIV